MSKDQKPIDRQTIERHHYIIDKPTFLARKVVGSNALQVRRFEKTVEIIKEYVGRIEWGWINKDIYQDDALKERIQSPEFRLYGLYDTSASNEPIGYAIITIPDSQICNQFLPDSAPEKVIEIENLALFPGNEKGQRGWSFFQQIMAELFKSYDNVYWSVSDTNHPGLHDYYMRNGMMYLGKDEVSNYHLKSVNDNRRRGVPPISLTPKP